MKKIKMICCGFLGFLLFGGAALTTGAFLTHSTEKLINRVIPGILSADLTEPDWNPENGKHMLPGSSIIKNPIGENTGTLAAWMFMELDIPVKKISLVDSITKMKKKAEETELFSFQIENGWQQISKERTSQGMKYVFGYEEIVKPLEKTNPLFTELTIVPYLEGELNPEEIFDIPVMLHCVQSNICEPEKNLKEVYKIYVEKKKEGGEI